MTDLLQPLTADELQTLDDFLREHADDLHEADPDAEPGVLNLSECEGMLCALISGPTLVKTAEWVPALWGEEEPEWRSEAEFDRIVQLLQRYMNTLAATLQEAPDDYQPLFLYEDEGGTTYTIVDDWCEGYLRGVRLGGKAWNAGKPLIGKLLDPIRAFSSETEWRGHELSADDSDRLSDAIAPNTRAIHAFWLERRRKN
jgi:uncharacterized protein